MALFGGPRRPAPEREDRSIMIPAPSLPYGSYADFGPVTGDTAIQAVAVRSTIDLIASLGSELPATVVSGRGAQRQELPTPANLADPGGDDMGLEDWVYRLLYSWLTSGNTVGLVTSREPNTARRLTVDLINQTDVQVSAMDGRPVWTVNGRRANDSDIAHWRVNPVPGRLLGLSPIEQHAATIGVSLSSTRFGRQWFTDGAHPSGMFRNTLSELSPSQAAEAKVKFLAATRGSREPVVVGKGWEFSEIQVSPEESQFLETQRFTEAQCARIYGPGFAEILGYETGGSMTYANIVDRRQDLLVLSMNKWLRRVERVLSSLVAPGQRVELNREALLEATTLQRYQAHTASLTWKSVNEVRAIEGLPPVSWGDAPNGAPAPQSAQ